jgi:hypothetical protein
VTDVEYTPPDPDGLEEARREAARRRLTALRKQLRKENEANEEEPR